jgi:hypothetical protein
MFTATWLATTGLHVIRSFLFCNICGVPVEDQVLPAEVSICAWMSLMRWSHFTDKEAETQKDASRACAPDSCSAVFPDISSSLMAAPQWGVQVQTQP